VNNTMHPRFKWNKLKYALPLLFMLFFSQPETPAQEAGSWGDNLVIRLALIGPGRELYFWWGHVGLVVENRFSGHALFYDWGVFNFDSENFFFNFAMGNLNFYTAATPAEIMYAHYIANDRDVILFTLNLPAEKVEAIVLFAENNVLPENRYYAYHHFNDNCSTRIRDIIDMVLDGQFKARYGEAPGRFTLREHVRRHTWFNPLFDWALNFWMGQVIDRPITVWDEMFLPSELAKRVNGFSFIDADGIERPLVSSVEYFHLSQTRPEVLETPRLQWPLYLIGSLLFSAALLLLYKFFRFSKIFRRFLGITISFFGLFFGIAGSMLFFLTFFTNHDYTFENINVLFVNPLFWVIIPLGLRFAFTDNDVKRAKAIKILQVFWAYVFVGGFISIVIRILPAFYQQNQVTQALILPVAFTLAFLMSRIGHEKEKSSC